MPRMDDPSSTKCPREGRLDPFECLHALEPLLVDVEHLHGRIPDLVDILHALLIGLVTDTSHATYLECLIHVN